jgi:hypothetical protein
MATNEANPLHVGGNGLPALNDGEREAVIQIGLAGGSLPRHRIGGSVVAALERLRLVAASGPTTIMLTARGIGALADAAKAATDA